MLGAGVSSRWWISRVQYPSNRQVLAIIHVMYKSMSLIFEIRVKRRLYWDNSEVSSAEPRKDKDILFFVGIRSDNVIPLISVCVVQWECI